MDTFRASPSLHEGTKETNLSFKFPGLILEIFSSLICFLSSCFIIAEVDIFGHSLVAPFRAESPGSSVGSRSKSNLRLQTRF